MSKRVKMEPEDLVRSAYTIARIDAVLECVDSSNPSAPVIMTAEGWAVVSTALRRHRSSIAAGTTPRMFLTKKVLVISDKITDEQ